jgi:hypothetical protein
MVGRPVATLSSSLTVTMLCICRVFGPCATYVNCGAKSRSTDVPHPSDLTRHSEGGGLVEPQHSVQHHSWSDCSPYYNCTGPQGFGRISLNLVPSPNCVLSLK